MLLRLADSAQAVAAVCAQLTVFELPPHVPVDCWPVHARHSARHLGGLRIEGGCPFACRTCCAATGESRSRCGGRAVGACRG